GLALVLVAVGGAAVLLRPAPGAPGQAVTASAAHPGKAMTFTEIFERVSPAVVSINVTLAVDPRSQRDHLFGFGPDEEERGQEVAPEDQGPVMQRSSGSGFFISPDGLVLTNNHVVEDGGEITVALKDGRELKAAIVGRDETTDLALLRVADPKDPKARYPYVDFEDAAMPRVGDWIIAIGNPFGLGGTATAGIVSAYGRDIGQGVDFLQIDAPINRGNSGGPSFDVYGRVIGVNTAIYSPSGGSVGIGFAVPADQAAAIAAQLRTGKTILRGYIGASVGTLTPGLAQSQTPGVDSGALVAETTPGAPAARAGLRAGDVVVAVDGARIRTGGELTRAIGKAKPGQIVRLGIVRDGRRRTVIVRTGTRPSERELADRSGRQEGG
ncbi:MAG TPA: trypsin-like peptidase domain-containing protein, partial [Caulobacteraceae bacterium]|nr:trypsin-like peptidase domain-containing protein [Caulobacteraceae bacterium]